MTLIIYNNAYHDVPHYATVSIPVTAPPPLPLRSYIHLGSLFSHTLNLRNHKEPHLHTALHKSLQITWAQHDKMVPAVTKICDL
jgi:hypothetical protein